MVPILSRSLKNVRNDVKRKGTHVIDNMLKVVGDTVDMTHFGETLDTALNRNAKHPVSEVKQITGQVSAHTHTHARAHIYAHIHAHTHSHTHAYAHLQALATLNQAMGDTAGTAISPPAITVKQMTDAMVEVCTPENMHNRRSHACARIHARTLTHSPTFVLPHPHEQVVGEVAAGPAMPLLTHSATMCHSEFKGKFTRNSKTQLSVKSRLLFRGKRYSIVTFHQKRNGKQKAGNK